MKCISLWQPWASLIAIGEKHVETRSFYIKHRGLIAIHAAKKWDGDLDEQCFEQPFRDYLEKAGYIVDDGDTPCSVPRGVIVAIAEVFACMPTHEIPDVPWLLADHEFYFGDFTVGRWGWMLQNVRALKEPIPAKGQQGLWEWTPPDNLEELLLPAERSYHAAKINPQEV